MSMLLVQTEFGGEAPLPPELGHPGAGVHCVVAHNAGCWKVPTLGHMLGACKLLKLAVGC